jgi:2-hydroxy-3-keto-5-methylthiopentenyl-1-phosphate phosphatase
MRLWCYFAGHRFSVTKNKRGLPVYKTCKRCDAFLVRDYFNGWQNASKSEREYNVRMFGSLPRSESEITSDS